MTSAVLWPFLLWNHRFILLKFCLHYFIGSKREVRCIKLLQFLITFKWRFVQSVMVPIELCLSLLIYFDNACVIFISIYIYMWFFVFFFVVKEFSNLKSPLKLNMYVKITFQKAKVYNTLILVNIKYKNTVS